MMCVSSTRVSVGCSAQKRSGRVFCVRRNMMARVSMLSERCERKGAASSGRRKTGNTLYAFGRNGESSRLMLRTLREKGTISVGCKASKKINIPEPKSQPEIESAKFGFTEYAERINSRFAMIGFFALLAVEGIFNVSILQVIGLDIGKGIDLPL